MAAAANKQAVSLNDVVVKIAGKQVGYITKLDLNVTINENILYEAGSKGMPIDRVFLKREISGSFDRTYVDNDVLAQLWDFTLNSPIEFELTAQIEGFNANGRDFVLRRCAIKGFPISLELESETTQSFEFSAIGFDFV